VSINLRDVNKDNWRQIVKLKLVDGQENFVAPNWYSILQAHFEFGYARAVYLDDTPIGFTWYGTNPPEDNRWWIIRFMIAADYQGKGYGRKAIEAVIADMRSHPTCKDIHISFVPDNVIARALYEKIGFVDTGEVDEDELVFRLPG
jgi:diamine N-acetyltransferase